MVKPRRPQGITEELIDASVSRNSRKLMTTPGAMSKIEQLFEGELPKLLQLIAPITEKYDRIIAIADQTAKLVGPVAACGKGCSHCCHQAVAIGSTEADTIGRFIGKTPAEVAMPTCVEEIQDPLRYVRTACPFLVNNECSIYPVRPVACRTYFNLSDYPEICNLYDYEGGTVPSMNMSPIWKTQSAIAINGGDILEGFGDIREFFPEEFAKSQAASTK